MDGMKIWNCRIFRWRRMARLSSSGANPRGQGGLLEKLKMEKVEKIPIIIRGRFLSSDTWFGNKVAQFNMENSTCHVIVEDCGSGNDEEDFARLTASR